MKIALIIIDLSLVTGLMTTFYLFIKNLGGGGENKYHVYTLSQLQ